MSGSTRTLRGIAHGTDLDGGAELGGTDDRSIEVVHFEPQQHPMTQRTDVGLTQRAVMVLDLPTVQLEHETSVGVDEPFVVGSAVVAPCTEKMLEPPARGLDVVDGEKRLRPHR